MREGFLNVEKDVEFNASNYWPVGHKEWTEMKRTQKVTKVVQQMHVGQYFGEVELFTSKGFPSRIIAGSEKVMLVCFTKEMLEGLLTKEDIRRWVSGTLSSVQYVCWQ